MALTSKIEAFKKHFEIDSTNANIEFCLDTKNKTRYGAEFLRAIKLERPKKTVVRSKEIKDADKQVLINGCKYANSISEDWGIDSYSYVNEYWELMLNEECYETLKILKSL